MRYRKPSKEGSKEREKYRKKEGLRKEDEKYWSELKGEKMIEEKVMT